MPESHPSRRLLLFLGGIYLALLLIPAGFLPLMETTDARYAEIAREMLASGNFLEPFFNGIKHFHKPPLAYWLIAAGLKIFGINDFGARFFGIVAAVLAVFFLHRLAATVLGDERKALHATCIFAASGLFFVVSRIVSTDIYLTCFTIIAQYYLFRRLCGDRRHGVVLLYAVALGLGFMTKGPIIFLFTLLPFFVAKLFDRSHRNAFTWGETGMALAVFLLISLPWYLAVWRENPALMHYFLKVQTVDRVVTNRFHRYEPAWYFLVVFAGGFLPYILFFLRGLFAWKTLPRRALLLLVYIAVPMLVFTVSQSKLATYILPFFGVAALFTAEVFAVFPMPKLRRATLLLLALVAAAIGVAGFVYRPVWEARFLLAAVVPPAAAALWQAYRSEDRQRFLLWSAGAFLLICSAGLGGVALAGPEFNGYEAMAAKINALDPDRNIDVMVYREFLPSVSFYRGELAAMALGTEREIQFQKDDSYRRQYLPTEHDLTDFLSSRRQVFVIAKPQKLRNFLPDTPFQCDTIFVQRKYSAFYCEKPDQPPTTD